MSTVPAPAAAMRFGRGSEQTRGAHRPSTPQPQLSVRDRQRAHLLLNWVEQLRGQEEAGGIHSAKIHSNGTKMTVEVLFDDGRRRTGNGDADGPTQRGTQPRTAPQGQTAPQRRPQPARERSQAARASKVASTATQQEMRIEEPYDPEIMEPDPFHKWEATLTKKEAKSIERATKAIITEVVRTFGGTEQHGHKLLQPAIDLQLGDHKVRLRLPTNSAATRLNAADLENNILSSWWDNSSDPERGAREMRVLMTPTAHPLGGD